MMGAMAFSKTTITLMTLTLNDTVHCGVNGDNEQNTIYSYYECHYAECYSAECIIHYQAL